MTRANPQVTEIPHVVSGRHFVIISHIFVCRLKCVMQTDCLLIFTAKRMNCLLFCNTSHDSTKNIGVKILQCELTGVLPFTGRH